MKDAVLVRRFKSLGEMLPKDMKLLNVGCGDAQFLLALRDAGNYITTKAEHEAAEWQGDHGSFDPGRDVGRTNDVRAHLASCER